MLACAPACSLGGPVSEPLLRAPHPNPSSGCEGQPFPAAGPQGGHQVQRQAPVKGGVVRGMELASGARPRQVGRGRAATRGCEGLRWHVVLRSGRAASSDVHSGAKEGTISRADARAEMAGSQRLTEPALPGPRVCSIARVTTAGSQRRAKRRHRSCVGGQGRCRPRARAQGKEGGWRCQTAAISLLILNALSSPHPIQRRGCRAGAVKGWRAAGSSPTSRLPALRVLCSQ